MGMLNNLCAGLCFCLVLLLPSSEAAVFAPHSVWHHDQSDRADQLQRHTSSVDSEGRYSLAWAVAPNRQRIVLEACMGYDAIELGKTSRPSLFGIGFGPRDEPLQADLAMLFHTNASGRNDSKWIFVEAYSDSNGIIHPRHLADDTRSRLISVSIENVNQHLPTDEAQKNGYKEEEDVEEKEKLDTKNKQSWSKRIDTAIENLANERKAHTHGLRRQKRAVFGTSSHRILKHKSKEASFRHWDQEMCIVYSRKTDTCRPNDYVIDDATTHVFFFSRLAGGKTTKITINKRHYDTHHHQKEQVDSPLFAKRSNEEYRRFARSYSISFQTMREIEDLENTEKEEITKMKKRKEEEEEEEQEKQSVINGEDNQVIVELLTDEATLNSIDNQFKMLRVQLLKPQVPIPELDKQPDVSIIDMRVNEVRGVDH